MSSKRGSNEGAIYQRESDSSPGPSVAYPSFLSRFGTGVCRPPSPKETVAGRHYLAVNMALYETHPVQLQALGDAATQGSFPSGLVDMTGVKATEAPEMLMGPLPDWSRKLIERAFGREEMTAEQEAERQMLLESVLEHFGGKGKRS